MKTLFFLLKNNQIYTKKYLDTSKIIDFCFIKCTLPKCKKMLIKEKILTYSDTNINNKQKTLQ